MKRLMDQPCADGYAPVHGATNVTGKIDDVSPLPFVAVLCLTYGIWVSKECWISVKQAVLEVFCAEHWISILISVLWQSCCLNVAGCRCDLKSSVMCFLQWCVCAQVQLYTKCSPKLLFHILEAGENWSITSGACN